jgi:hypothetical protein
MRTGNHFWFPASFVDRFFAPWQRPRGVASSAHRKSGVVICLSYACPVESFLLPSAYFLSTPLQLELQASFLACFLASSQALFGFPSSASPVGLSVSHIFGWTPGVELNQ